MGVIVGLLGLVRAGLPDKTKVLLSADRGIGTSPELCRQVDAMGFKYLFRVTKQSKIITAQGEYTIHDQARPGKIWAACGKVFKKRGRIPAHVRAIWDDGCAAPWILVTNDPSLSGREYGRRNWQEQSFPRLEERRLELVEELRPMSAADDPSHRYPRDRLCLDTEYGMSGC